MSSGTVPQFGWIGLGSMGLGMARNLQRYLNDLPGASPLIYTNRTMSRGQPLAELHGRPCESISAVACQSDIIFVSVCDDPVLRTIVQEIIDSGDIRGKIIVETTTINPSTSKEINELLTASGAVYIASPVFGASPLAESGQLLFILGGPNTAIDTISPFIKGVMGRDIVRAGEDPSRALLMKTIGNFITASLMEVISEAHVFAEKSSLGTEALEKLIKLNWGGVLHSTSTRITSGAYLPRDGERPRSDLTLAIKDVQHGITSAQDAGARLQVAEVVLDHYKEAKTWADKQGGRPLDSSSMYGVIREEAGLEFESDVVKNFAK